MFGTHPMIRTLSQSASRARSAVRPLALVLLGLAGLSCADSSNYLYRPAENATAVTEGFTAARYTIPPSAPKGDVRVASFGLKSVSKEENGPEFPAVHVRLIVSNDSGATAWTVDPTEIRVELRGDKPKSPAVVSADVNPLPQISIQPGEERTLDLFYPLAQDQEDASNVPAFDVLWKVHTEAGEIVERTPFERIPIVQNTTMSYGMGYSPYWWSNPWYYSSYPISAGPGLAGPGMLGPGTMAPSIGPQFHIGAHPSLHR